MKITYTKQQNVVDKKGRKRIIPQMMVKVAVNDDEATNKKTSKFGGQSMDIEKQKPKKDNKMQ